MLAWPLEPEAKRQARSGARELSIGVASAVLLTGGFIRLLVHLDHGVGNLGPTAATLHDAANTFGGGCGIAYTPGQSIRRIFGVVMY
jgi:hypothetical protein